MPLFERRDIEQYTDNLASYLPNNILFESRHVEDTVLRNLLVGFAGELFRVNGLIKEYVEEIIPDTTVKFIPEYESLLGIPDECFKGERTLDERRRDILVKIASSGVQTADDFVNLAALFGITVTVVSAAEASVFPLILPFQVFDNITEARFTIIVSHTGVTVDAFPYTFPFVFGSSQLAVLECLFNKLKPSNCKVIFKEAP